MEIDRPATQAELDRLHDLVERAGRHEPIAYLIGHWWFFGLELEVTPATLIPRPSTESVVEHLLQQHRAANVAQDPLIADIGTGCGAIAIALAANLPNARIVATDVAGDALEVAGRNAGRHRVVDRIEFCRGSLYEPLGREGVIGPLHYLVSNPPYIRDREWLEVARNIRDYEPAKALRAGDDGLEYLRPMIQGAHRFVRPGGWIIFEIAASQSDEVLKIASANEALLQSRILQDHEGLPRVFIAQSRTGGNGGSAIG